MRLDLLNNDASNASLPAQRQRLAMLAPQSRREANGGSLVNTPRATIGFWMNCLLLVCLVPASGLTVSMVTYAFLRERETIEATTVATARALVQVIGQDLLNGQSALAALATSPGLRSGDLAEFRQQALEVLQTQSGNGIVLVDATGQQLMSTITPDGVHLPRTGVPALLAIIARTGKPAVSDFYIGATSKQPQIAIGIPVNRGDKPPYMLTMGFMPSRLQVVLNGQNLPSGWIATVIDAKGTVVARSKMPDKFVGKAVLPDFLKRLEEAREATTETTNLQGEAILAGFSHSEPSGWSVAVSVPLALLTADLYRSLWLTGSGAAALLIIAGLTAKFASRHIAQSIRALIDPALALASGRSFVQPVVDVAEVHDVVIALAKASQLLDQRAEERDASDLAQRKMAIAKGAAEASAAAKSNFLATMSHEIRTPMNALLGFAQLLAGTPLLPGQQEYVRKMLDAGRSLLAVINDILDFSVIESGMLVVEQDHFSLDELLDGVCDVMASTAAKKPLELALAIEPDVPDHIVGDGSRLRQILVNLVGNAIKFTDYGSVLVRVAVEAQDADCIMLHFAVTDTGIGIDKNALACVFNAFTQADSSTTRLFGGSGLGLAICRRIAGLMGGTISAESSPGSGSIFRLALPFRLDTQAAAAPVFSVTLLEPHPVSRTALTTTLQSLGWAVNRSPADFVLKSRLATATGPADSTAGGSSAMLFRAVSSPDVDVASGAPVPAVVNLTKPVSRAALREAARRHFLPPAPPAPQVPARLAGLRVLIVEDNLVNQMVAQALLQREGALTAIADNGVSALELLRADPGGLDLILMDTQMPVMGGLEAAQAIRYELGLTKIPIIACTAGVLEAEQAQAIAAGMNDFITKPIMADSLVRTIYRHWQP